MLIKDTYILRLLNYLEKIKNEKLREKYKGSKRTLVDGGRFFHQRSKNSGNGKAQNGQRYSSQNSSNASTVRFDKDNRSNPTSQGGGKDTQTIPTCKKCGKTHKGECSDESDVCFRCGKSSYHAKDYKVKVVDQVTGSDSNMYCF